MAEMTIIKSKNPKEPNCYKWDGLTEGNLLAIFMTLQYRYKREKYLSPVENDIHIFLGRYLKDNGTIGEFN